MFFYHLGVSLPYFRFLKKHYRENKRKFYSFLGLSTCYFKVFKSRAQAKKKSFWRDHVSLWTSCCHDLDASTIFCKRPVQFLITRLFELSFPKKCGLGKKCKTIGKPLVLWRNFVLNKQNCEGKLDFKNHIRVGAS